MAEVKTRILHLIDSYRIGGPGKTILNSARFIDSNRFRLQVASFAPPDESVNEFGNAVITAGIPYHGLVENKRFDLSQAAALRELLSREKIDIFHSHGYKSDILGYLACRRLPETRFVTTHHGWIENRLSQKAFTRLALALTRSMDGVVCVASHLMDLLPSSVRNSGKATLIHNALVLQDYRPSDHRETVRRELGVGQEQTLIGVIGRLSEEKGCFEALEAFRPLAARVEDLRLVFIGEGPLDGKLRAMVDNSGLGDKVLFAGHRSPIQPVLEGLDMVLSPSRTEGLSNVLLEALAFRLPVVATQVGGNAEIIRHEATGILVPPGRPEALTSGLERLLQDPDGAREMAEAGRQTVESEFSFETRMRRMESFYDRLPGDR